MIYINYRQNGVDVSFKDKNKIYDRLNGPAYFNGNKKIWYKKGRYHRLTGPAVISAQNREYWIEDIFIMKVNIMKK